MIHLLFVALLSQMALAQVLELNPDNFTLLPEENTVTEEVPLIYDEETRAEQTTDGILIFENEPMVLRPEEDDL